MAKLCVCRTPISSVDAQRPARICAIIGRRTGPELSSRAWRIPLRCDQKLISGLLRRKPPRTKFQILSMAVDSGGSLPPSSRKETLEQAGSSLYSLLQKALKSAGPITVKQRKSLRQQRLRVDIPVRDESPEAQFSLILDFIEAFLGRKNIPGTVALYLPTALLSAVPTDLVSGSQALTTRYLGLDVEQRCPFDTAVVVIVWPEFKHAQAIDFLVTSAGHRPVVVLNGRWSSEEEANKTWGPLLRSFEVAYSFTPLAIKGFLSVTEGAVLKHVKSGAPAGRPWLIFVKEAGGYKCVSSLTKRPEPADLENALYSSIAANSPINKSIKFLRGILSD